MNTSDYLTHHSLYNTLTELNESSKMIAEETCDSTTPAPTQIKLIESLEIQSEISNSRAFVYRAFSPITNLDYALKLFPYDNSNEISESYINEKRFLSLHHTNIIRFEESIDKLEVELEEAKGYASCIMMELALCDFAEILENSVTANNEKLCRTFFR